MKTFLDHVAASLLSKFGSNLSHVTVVFPGKRASLFLNQSLAEQSPTPVWAPRYQTISELFLQASPYALADPVEAVCRLYNVYARRVEDAQPLDRFWSWGEILLADFDDVDKHMVEALRLFQNIADLRALDDNSYITPEQEEALRAFFHHFSLEGNSEIKQQFLRLWNHMGEIYTDFLTELRANGILYEGALQREVIERLRKARLAADDHAGAVAFDTSTTYVFVGFNVLNDVEQALFDELKARHQALFYWDYDLFYVERSHEAGHFLRQNLERYGNELPASCFDNLRQPKDITFITATSENAQARYIPQWLYSQLTSRENRSAVVLCNEQLLQPVLHSIPSEGHPSAVNITMGYPLTETPVFSFVSALVTLQTDGYDPTRQRFRPALLRLVERHPFTASVHADLWRRPAGQGVGLLNYLLEILTALAPHFQSPSVGTSSSSHPTPPLASGPVVGGTSADIPPIYRQLYAEALFKTFTAISRLRDLMTASLLEVNDHTLRRVLRSILQMQTVPFHGEPATGLQVMGVLETRALDFDHVLMLSVGEGFLPKTVSDTSLIPYNLREAFGLTTVRHKIAVYAYYFYRIIQRASRITFVYNESNAGTRQNEPSRFLRQLLAETDFPIRTLRLESPSRVEEVAPIIVEKTPEIIDRLRRTYDRCSVEEGQKTSVLSPTAINTYTTCPLSFYYRYVKGLSVQHDPQDGLDAVLFGEVFHCAAELLYRQLTVAGKVIRRQDIEPLMEHDGQRLQPIIREAFRRKFFQGRPEDYSGILIIAERVLQTYLVQLLRHDLQLTPFSIIGLEQWFDITLPVAGMEIRTGGIIDRLDEVRDSAVEGEVVLRAVDYKTGGFPAPVSDIERLFAETGQKEHYYLQTILYATIVAIRESRPVIPCLFFVHKAGAEDYSPKLKLSRQFIQDVRPLKDDFLQRLTDVIAEIFTPDIPFTQTQKIATCANCDFSHLCGR